MRRWLPTQLWRPPISAVVVIQGHQDITTGIAIAVPLAAAGQVLTIFVRTITVFFQHQADNFAKTANFRGIELMHISGMALQGLRVAYSDRYCGSD